MHFSPEMGGKWGLSVTPDPRRDIEGETKRGPIVLKTLARRGKATAGAQLRPRFQESFGAMRG